MHVAEVLVLSHKGCMFSMSFFGSKILLYTAKHLRGKTFADGIENERS